MELTVVYGETESLILSSTQCTEYNPSHKLRGNYKSTTILRGVSFSRPSPALLAVALINPLVTFFTYSLTLLKFSVFSNFIRPNIKIHRSVGLLSSYGA